MNKNDYINNLKKTDLRPGKVRIKEREEVILMEDKTLAESKLLQELFIKLGEITAMSKNPRKDMAILRLAVVAEYDAASLYEQMAQQVSAPEIKKVLLEVANEEKAHIGEFEFLLEKIDPDHEKRENEGESEAMNLTGWDEAPSE